MSGSTTGVAFRVTTFGASHGPAVGAVIDGCPPGLSLDCDALQDDLDRRRPGQSELVSPRDEADRVEVLSGLFKGRTTGTPLTLLVRNRDARPEAYQALAELYRPSHADLTYEARYGIRDWRGGGRASARETAARVAAGAVARQWLASRHGICVVAWVAAVGDAVAPPVDLDRIDRAAVDADAMRCPDPDAARAMRALIEAARAQEDSVGGVVACVARGVPPGWGAPVFDKLEADLAKACLSIPACRGFEIGSGFRGARMRGSEHNDAFTMRGGRIRTLTNHAGGVLGGISSGEHVVIRCAFKPVATIGRPQHTVTRDGQPVELAARGRHDPCVLPRAAPIVEAAVLLTLADHALRTPIRAGARSDQDPPHQPG